MRPTPLPLLLSASLLLAGSAAFAQPARPGPQPAPQAQGAPPSAERPAAEASTGAPAPLVVLFSPGSSELRPADRAVLDRASRAYNEGKPIVMIVTGTSDRVGSARMNLSLSERRASAVLRGLLDRGIPADRFQVLAKGQTELPVETKSGVSEAQNRRVEISWH